MQKHYKVPLLDEYHLFVEENSDSIVIPRDGGDELSFYLEENLLGVIIPALQELLKDSSMMASPEYASDDMKQQEHTKSTNVYSKVDPLSWIAMYLIRNNPKHSSEIQNHPYYKLLKEHVEHIRPLVEQSRKTLQKSQEDIRHEIKDLALQKFKSK